MNSISISGSLGKDCEVRYLASGDPVCSFSVADSQGKDKTTIWWSCNLFGKRAESLSQYLTKGQAVTVIGNVTERTWKDKETGVDRKAMDIRVQDVALQGGRKEATEAPTKAQPKKQAHSMPDNSVDDDIPF